MPHRYRVTSLLLIALAAVMTARGQEAYRKSWTIQDRRYGLMQDIARDLIGRANDWLTRDDPNAQTARLDDAVRVTVITEFLPSTGHLRDRLSQLSLGTIVLKDSFTQFLDTTTINSLVRRDHFWREESIEVLNVAYADLQPIDGLGTNQDDLELDRAFGAAGRQPRVRIGLDETSVHVGGSTFQPWLGFGFEEIALPDFSYGRARVGVSYGRMKLWSELPLPLGTVGNPVLARGLESTVFGIGMSFETDAVGGAVSITDPSQRIGTAAVDGDTAWVLGRAAILYWKIPFARFPLLGGFVRLKIGGGYEQFVPVRLSYTGPAALGEAEDIPKFLARVEYAAVDDDGDLRRTASLHLFGTSVAASYLEQLDRAFGLRLSIAVHGIAGTRAPYLPSFSFTISPTFSLW